VAQGFVCGEARHGSGCRTSPHLRATVAAQSRAIDKLPTDPTRWINAIASNPRDISTSGNVYTDRDVAGDPQPLGQSWRRRESNPRPRKLRTEPLQA